MWYLFDFLFIYRSFRPWLRSCIVSCLFMNCVYGRYCVFWGLLIIGNILYIYIRKYAKSNHWLIFIYGFFCYCEPILFYMWIYYHLLWHCCFIVWHCLYHSFYILCILEIYKRYTELFSNFSIQIFTVKCINKINKLFLFFFLYMLHWCSHN